MLKVWSDSFIIAIMVMQSKLQVVHWSLKCLRVSTDFTYQHINRRERNFESRRTRQISKYGRLDLIEPIHEQ